MSGRDGESGMSLLELLVALVLLSLVSAAIASALRLGAAAATRYERTSGSHMEVALTQAALRRLIEGARPVTARTDTGTREVVFAGEEQRLVFLVDPPDDLGLGGPYEMTLALTDAGGKKHLAAEFRRYPPEAEPRDSPHETVLLEHLESLSFKYFGQTGEGGTPSWKPSWNGQRSLPRLVSLKIGFREGDRRRWPELIAAPRIEEAHNP